MIRPIALGTVLDDARASGLLDDDGIRRVTEAAARADAEHTPWFLRILIGGAAWVGACFFLSTLLGILAIALNEHLDVAAVVLGVGSAIGGVLLGRQARSEFRRQAALVGVVAGQMLMLGGLADIVRTAPLMALATIVTSLGLMAVFADQAYRFLATLAVIGAALVVMLNRRLPFTLDVAAALVTLLPLLTWRGGAKANRHAEALEPVAWAGVIAVWTLLLADTLVDAFASSTLAAVPESWDRVLWSAPWPLTIFFAGLLAWLAVQVSREHGGTAQSADRAAALMGIVALAITTWPTPAVCGAVFLLALGFDRRRPGVVGIGAAGLVSFLGLYYHSLSLTLMQKSIVLVLSGLVCLVAAVYFRRRIEVGGAS